MKLLFDMSSLLWTNLMAGKDEENGHEEPNEIEGRKPVWINSAAFGFENFVNNWVRSCAGTTPRRWTS